MTNSIAGATMAIGSGTLGLLGRSWDWSAENFLRSPIASTGLILTAGLVIMAGTNALYLQETRHPAPMFGIVSDRAPAASSLPAPIAPVVVEPTTVPSRPETAPMPTASFEPMPDAAPTQQDGPTAPSIGNQDIADMQEKLQAMGFFDGTVDGYYGPKTADAIRAFEARFNLPRTGAATPQLLQAVRDAPLSTSAAAPQVPSVSPAPTPVAAAPDTNDVAPLLAQMQQDAQPVAQETSLVADIAPDPVVNVMPTSTDASVPAALDRDLVSEIQRGLSRLGFLQGPVNGVADESTARAIRKFQIFNNFSPTGEVSQSLRQMLVSAGAYL
ncbi:peptidoglycan-binding domain-containing protein [Pelagibacterium luteolum]|uniref:Putative peptidoglycan binding domain-containing protein n=1 Tax=Pelagibacterium luteolum TaxID=440168 RepID=A0A1G7TRP7_9HYPH|nr:peptidoglycan-binding protein [Pelagibacterium luteolum]SDG38013.1 Putative peptidoglycan binding domain-containing protein [Pelagibacterium luteolum]